MCFPSSGETSMDLNHLSMGSPRPPGPGLDLGFDLALGPASASAFSSSSTEESHSPSPAAAAMAEPRRLLPHPPSSPLSPAFADSTDHPPPTSIGGAGPARDYAPFSPSYQSPGLAHAPITAPHPPPVAAAASSHRHGAIHSASYVRVFHTDRDSDRGFDGDEDSDRGFDGDDGGIGLHLPNDPLLPQAGPEVEAVVGGGVEGSSLPLPHDLHLPYSPSSYALVSMNPEDQEGAAYGQRPIVLGSPDVFVSDAGGSSSRHGLVDAELRLKRLEGDPFPLPNSYGDELPRASAAADPLGQHEREPLGSEASAEIAGKTKAGDEGITDKDLGKDKDERNACAVNFQCNICLELAKEPVLTPCGHPFCWPCLYQWLQLHCHYNECPVCKEEVLEFEITPIYGWGSSQSRLEEEEDKELGLKIPPRPRKRRLESYRQRIQRPLSRRVGSGVTNFRRLSSADVDFGSMIDDHGFLDYLNRSLLDELERVSG